MDRQGEVERRQDELRAIHCPVEGYTVWGCKCSSCKSRRLDLKNEMMLYCPEAYLSKEAMKKWRAENLPPQGKKKGKEKYVAQSDDSGEDWCLSD